MAKIAVVYWSGTGNTQAMAEAVLEGAKAGGAEEDAETPNTALAFTGTFDGNGHTLSKHKN